MLEFLQLFSGSSALVFLFQEFFAPFFESRASLRLSLIGIGLFFGCLLLSAHLLEGGTEFVQLFLAQSFVPRLQTLR